MSGRAARERWSAEERPGKALPDGMAPASPPVATPAPDENAGRAPTMAVVSLLAQPSLKVPLSSYFCPCCLRRVPAEAAERRTQHEDGASGGLDVDLVRCPRCGLVLAAEVSPPAAWNWPAA